jgi:hypothetical protein
MTPDDITRLARESGLGAGAGQVWSVRSCLAAR